MRFRNLGRGKLHRFTTFSTDLTRRTLRPSSLSVWLYVLDLRIGVRILPSTI